MFHLVNRVKESFRLWPAGPRGGASASRSGCRTPTAAELRDSIEFLTRQYAGRAGDPTADELFRKGKASVMKQLNEYNHKMGFERFETHPCPKPTEFCGAEDGKRLKNRGKQKRRASKPHEL